MKSSLKNMQKGQYPAFLEKDADSNPFNQFTKWYNEVAEISEEEASSMVLATADNEGRPCARIVLLKKFSEEGFVFYTNTLSRKGTHMSFNPNVALLFYWPSVYREVRIEGQVSMISEKDSDVYFHSRPKGNQISAVISPQSEIIPDRKCLEEKFKRAESTYSDKEIPRPLFWRGYIVVPEYFEFWQGRENRLHDRLIYTYGMPEFKWIIKRLAP